MIEFIFLIVFVIGLSLALYKISLLSTKETSFEEAISNQPIDVLETLTRTPKKAKEKVPPKKMKSRRDDGSSHGKNHTNKAKHQHAKQPQVKHEPITAIEEKVQKEHSNEKSVTTNAVVKSSSPPVTVAKKQKLPEVKKEEALPKPKNPSPQPPKDTKVQKESSNPKDTKDTLNAKKAEIAKKSSDHEDVQDSVKVHKKALNENGPEVINEAKTEVSPSQAKKDKKKSEKSMNKENNPPMSTKDNKASQNKAEKVQGSKTNAEPLPKNTAKKSDVNEKKEAKNKIVVKEEVQQKSISMLLETHLPVEKKKKKDFIEPLTAARCTDDALAQLLVMIQMSQLSGSEVQRLIDELLTLQSDSDGPRGEEWVTKSDPVIALRRQLEESEAKLKEKSDSHHALSAKIQDLRSNLNEHISRNAAYKKQLEKTEENLQQKLEESNRIFEGQLLTKTNELKVNLEKEYQLKLEQSQNIAKEKLESQSQVLQNSIQEKEYEIKNMKNELAVAQSNCTMANSQLKDLLPQFEALRCSNDEASKLRQMTEVMESGQDQLKSEMDELKARLSTTEQELMSSRSSQNDLNTKFNHVTSERDLLYKESQELAELKKAYANNQIMLKAANIQSSELEAKIAQSEKDMTSCRETIDKQQAKIDLLNEEKHSLASQIIRPAAEGQENGDLHPEEHKQNVVNNHYNVINEDMHSLKKEISRLKEDCSRLSGKVHEERKKCDNISSSTRSVLLRIFPSIKSSDALDHEGLLKEVETAAVTAAAPKPKEVVPEPIIKTVEVEKIVEKVVPDQALIKEVKALKLENEELKRKVADLSESTSSDAKLSEELDSYKEVLRNTEALLRTLQKSVEEEETQFKEKIRLRDQEIKQLNEEKQKLTLQLDLKDYSQTGDQDSKLLSEISTLKESLDNETKEKAALQNKYSTIEQKLEALQVNSVNGPSNGIASDEDNLSLADNCSMVSSEGLGSASADDDSPAKNKKKKNFFSKLIRKSPSKEVKSKSTTIVE